MKTSLKRFTGCIFILGVLFLSAIPASHARELYVAYSVPGDIFHLGRIDHADPEVVEDLGTMGHKLFRALEFAGDGRLYAYENQLWGPSQLYEVNPSNAALTPVGPSGSQITIRHPVFWANMIPAMIPNRVFQGINIR